MTKQTSKESKGIVTFDLETTGVEPATDRIVQIAVVKMNNDGTVEKKKVLLNPTVPIPKEASDVHGITDEMVKNCPTFKQVGKSLYNYIEGCDLSGYNIIGFDLPMLVEELLRAEVQFNFDDVRIIDVMYIYKKLNPRTLSACYLQYTGKELDGAHDAMIDTDATVEVLEEMMKQESELQGMSLDDLHNFVERNEGRVDFAGKFIRNESGLICLNFGKHKGEPASKETGFVKWMLDKDFTQDTLMWANKIVKGEAI